MKQLIPQTIKGITHPLVKNVFVKQDAQSDNDHDSVLVIETVPFESEDDYELFDLYLLELLDQLKDLHNRAKDQVAAYTRYTRIDIRPHHV